MEYKNLLELIANSVTEEGELPQDFVLPAEDDSPVRFADGAKDGISLYHTRPSEMSDEAYGLMKAGFEAGTDYAAAFEAFDELFKKISPISAIDHIQNYICENALPGDKVSALSIQGMLAKKTDRVKLGLMIRELFGEPSEDGKDFFRVLGLCNEFTIFCIYNMKRWKNANEEIFELAKHTHGWGRVHAVRYLEADTDEIREWLLHEGCRNDVMPQYSALTVYRKLDLPDMFDEELSEDEFDDISFIMANLIDEGPVAGISAVENAMEVIGSYLTLAENRPLTAEVCHTVYGIFGIEPFADRAKKILQTEECRNIIAEEVKSGIKSSLAEYLGIEG